MELLQILERIKRAKEKNQLKRARGEMEVRK